MSHIIQKENNNVSRYKYLEFISLTIRALNERSEFDLEAKDMTAFIILLLKEIQKNIEKTTQAWEKRDYWLKADQFKREWQWCSDHINPLSKALKDNNWIQLKRSSSLLLEKCIELKISNKILNTSPWGGAYDRIKRELR